MGSAAAAHSRVASGNSTHVIKKPQLKIPKNDNDIVTTLETRDIMKNIPASALTGHATKAQEIMRNLQ